MSGVGRGPAGTAAPPPDWLAGASLPLTELAAGTTLLRIHREDRSPLFFSPGPHRPPVGRFDSATGRFGVMYLALTFEGTFAEMVLRNPARRLVAMGEIAGRALAFVAAARPLRLVQMHGAGLQHLGADNSVRPPALTNLAVVGPTPCSPNPTRRTASPTPRGTIPNRPASRCSPDPILCCSQRTRACRSPACRPRSPPS